MTAHYLVKGAVAVITLDNPPVNGMGHSTRTAIFQGMQRALGDDAVKAVVITGAGKAFSGGADIKEFNSPKALAEPTLHTLIDSVENSPKPVVAAIHSICIGGGLELALGCHYRVGIPAAQVGLPEVKIGILPGAGGTQRLPRVLGVEIALDMIVSGNLVSSEKLARTGLFDEMVEGDLLDAAIAFANRVAAVRPLPKVRDIRIVCPNYEDLLQSARVKVEAKAGPFPAPRKCVDAVEAAITKSFDDGVQFERALFFELVQTAESKALRHVFFAERAAGKVADVPEDTPIRAVATAAVVGAGTMGRGIAMAFANAGIPITIVEVAQTNLDQGLAALRQSYGNTLKKGKLTQAQHDERLALIKGTLSMEDIAQADIAVEAVFEDMSVKEQVFRKLDSVMKPGAILASNTSTLNIDTIAGFTQRAQDVIGLHFFSPANVMKLLEIVRGARTSKEVLATALALSKKLKKIGVVSGVCDGFIGNRMIEQYLRQAGFLLEEGALPEQVDRAIEQFGFAMGPFRMCDLAGNDIGWHIRQRRYGADGAKQGTAYSRTSDLLCEMGRFGQKTGAGWYDYKPGERTPYASQIVTDMIIGHSAKLGIVRRSISDTEIIERLVYALVNEGACILEEGIAQRASDIDIVYLNGYGFPLFRGGPMFYADTLGLRQVVAGMKRFAQGRHRELWKPASLLAELAAADRSFGTHP